MRFLPDMQRVVVNRFRRRSDAEECLRVLRRAATGRDYTLLYYPSGEESTFMVRKEYNKLVRDRIPEILKSQQVKFGVEEMTQSDYCQALRQKLIEEAQEAAEAVETNLVTELADLCEVIDATMDAYGVQRNQVLACQMQRRIDRGAFSQKLRLLWTET
ncbi:nucleoside triphosphate pyrophosphohydrolase [Leptolyngbya subtilissima ST-M1]|uniref:nucleoside triphosphate pyrophosphohydrolase n=1 Tax=Cyanophyceae TaxID=3028117 RepID=UPI0018EFAD0B|nr:nucleoside triphosphate pyrophosphohydrolase [Nodosilinea sp. FACHB-131]